eukprot:3228261-Prymnesium_polylepis.1
MGSRKSIDSIGWGADSPTKYWHILGLFWPSLRVHTPSGAARNARPLRVSEYPPRTQVATKSGRVCRQLFHITAVYTDAASDRGRG